MVTKKNELDLQQGLRTTLIGERPIRRESLFLLLGGLASNLAALDQGETLWQIYQAIMEVESWWNSNLAQEPV